MSTGIKLILLAVAFVSAASGVAIGQVGRSNTARTLDANYQLGSGGYNRPVGGLRGFSSQLYVTGQVTGLGRFHGNVGYYAANELRLDLPSASLSTFRRQSVGLSEVLAGRTYQTSAYYDPARTVLGTRKVISGAAVPGSNMPRISSAPSATTRRLYDEVLSRYKPILPLNPRSPLMTPLLVPSPSGGAAAIDPLAADRSRWTRPGSAALFGVLRAEDREQLVRELSVLQIRDDRVEAMVDARVDTSVKEPYKGADAVRPPELPSREPQTPQPAYRREKPVESPAARKLPEPDQDVFIDLLLKLKESRIAAEEANATKTGSQEPPGRAAPLKQKPKPSLRHGELVAAGKGGVVIHALAGKSADRFNMYMKQAEKKLKEGKFYAAAGKYELALIVDSNNPLARVGLALAMFCAGESLPAGSNIRRALHMFPALMETRVNITSLVDTRTFSRRLEWLEKRIEDTSPRRTEVLLVLMASFAHHNTGDTAKARKYAEMLQAASGDDRILSAYAKSILTAGQPAKPKPAATAPQTRPSEKNGS